jgi:hypothetical protein
MELTTYSLTVKMIESFTELDYNENLHIFPSVMFRYLLDGKSDAYSYLLELQALGELKTRYK